MATIEKIRVATIWLSGCSGCHMSFLDLDESLLELLRKIKIVYSPLIDVKTFPENVDVTLIEGAVANEEQQRLLEEARAQTKILISLGDCAVTGNVTALRNAWRDSDQLALEKAYVENSNGKAQIPTNVPKLLKKVRPLHQLVKVDHFIPGCPPSPAIINYVVTELLAGRTPNMEGRSKYG
jgi:NAD-reducing hydrogenase small subunit